MNVDFLNYFFCSHISECTYTPILSASSNISACTFIMFMCRDTVQIFGLKLKKISRLLLSEIHFWYYLPT